MDFDAGSDVQKKSDLEKVAENQRKVIEKNEKDKHVPLFTTGMEADVKTFFRCHIGV